MRNVDDGADEVGEKAKFDGLPERVQGRWASWPALRRRACWP